LSTNVPAPTFTDNGFQAIAESTILTGVFADLQSAFGGNLNPDLSTPQGQLASSIASMIGQNQDAFLFIASQLDPAFASGRYQDAIARIYFLNRLGPLPTTVAGVCTGASGTVIPAGSLAQSVDGTIYESTDPATIGGGGTVTVNFEAQTDGPITCPANSLTIIRTAIGGWDTVNNPSAGTPGRDTETRADFEARRSASVGLNSVGMLPSIRGALLNVSDVLDAYVTENSTGSSATIGGVSIAAHSLFVSVLGGSDADVARAIWLKKPPGCGYFGTTTVTVQDTSSGYVPPYPSYSVKFTRPTAVPIFYNVQISNSAGVPANAQALVRNAILSAFVGGDGDQREGIGGIVYATRYVTAVRNLGSWARIISLKVGTTSPGAADDVALNIDQAPTVDPANITVTIV
jgi:hypothetical protein